MKTCKWYNTAYGWKRVREDEALLILNGERVGAVVVYWDNVRELTEILLNLQYQCELLLPEEEVFV